MPDYQPDKTEVYSRGEALRWMRKMGWGEDLVDMIFYEDNPNLERVRELVYLHGPEEAERRLRMFLE